MASNIVMNIGEFLAGEGNEVAHIDLLIGSKSGPVGVAFATALTNQSKGHTNLLAVLTPNLICKPATVMITKVTIKGAGQAVQMFGPAQKGVGKAVADSVAEGIIPKAEAENLVIIKGYPSLIRAYRDHFEAHKAHCEQPNLKATPHGADHFGHKKVA